MKKILVATDFSKNSEGAIHFALNLAQVFKAEVELYNAFVTVPTIGIDGGQGIINETVIQAGIENNKVKLSKLIDQLPAVLTKDLVISKFVSSGDPVISICEYVAREKHDLLIMGTRGESRIEEILFGSTTVDVMKDANCPVLAVPPDTRFYGINRIVYATDLEDKDIAVIKHLCSLAGIFNAEVVIFHVFTDDNKAESKKAGQFNEKLVKSVNYSKLKRESVTYSNSHDAILEAVKKYNAAMLVMREKKRGIFQLLFHPDMVRKINFHTTIPLLTYNDNSL